MAVKKVSWRRSNQALVLFSLLLVPTYLFSADDYIRKIKSHLFMEEHILHEGVISRFSPDIDMAAAWDRLLKNRFTDSDLLLLKHEYAEACIMRGAQVSWEEAHPLANQIYNWQASLKG